MRAYELMENDDHTNQFEAVWAEIQKNCSQILHVYKQAGEFFYRGMENKPDIVLGQSRTNRIPTCSSTQFQKDIDEAFAKAGLPFGRASATFATSLEYAAGGYGTAYILFPFDGFKIMWSPKVYDANFDIVRSENWEDSLESDKYPNYQAYLAAIANTYKDTDILGALNSDNEILFHGKFYALNSETYKDLIMEKLS